MVAGVAGASRIDIANALRMEEGKAAAASSSTLMNTLVLQLAQVSRLIMLQLISVMNIRKTFVTAVVPISFRGIPVQWQARADV
jgi:hypothetical protein